MTRLHLTIIALVVVLAVAGVSLAASTAGEDSLLSQSWQTMQTASIYGTYKRQNKNEAATLEAYWANGGTAPTVATAFGQALVLEAQAYWSLHATPPPPNPACSDGLDNDGDGKIDYPNDPGCVSASDTDEFNAPPPPPAQCADGIDNDGDGLVDLADPGCTSSSDNDETNTAPPPPTGFPDASNTGVPDGTALTAYTGPTTITTDNTVIDGKEAGCLTIKATNVQIRNSYVHGNGCAVVIPEDPSVCVTASGGACTVTITDSTLSCNNQGGTAVYYRDYTVIRSDVSGCENGFDAGTNVLVKDTWVHDLWQESGAHTDDMQLSGGHVGHATNIVVDHVHFTGLDRNGGRINAAIISNGGNGDTGVVFKNSLFGGGGWTVYCPGWQSGGTPGPGDQVVNNHWKNDYGYGHSVGCSDPALTVSGNVDYPAGNPINLG